MGQIASLGALVVNSFLRLDRFDLHGAAGSLGFYAVRLSFCDVQFLQHGLLYGTQSALRFIVGDDDALFS